MHAAKKNWEIHSGHLAKFPDKSYDASNERQLNLHCNPCCLNYHLFSWKFHPRSHRNRCPTYHSWGNASWGSYVTFQAKQKTAPCSRLSPRAMWKASKKLTNISRVACTIYTASVAKNSSPNKNMNVGLSRQGLLNTPDLDINKITRDWACVVG